MHSVVGSSGAVCSAAGPHSAHACGVQGGARVFDKTKTKTKDWGSKKHKDMHHAFIIH